MINKLVIENFRSIKRVEIRLGKMNAIIGPNNAGKSNIMKALNLVLGDTYPSVRSFDEKDFYNYNESNYIKIEVRFDSPLTCNSSVYGFRLTFDGTDCEYFAIDNNGNVVTYSNSREVRVSNKMKEEVALMYLGLDRQASQQIKTTQWALYGKLVRYIERQMDEAQKKSFKKSIETSYKEYIYPHLIQVENILKNHLKEQTGLDLRLRLSILDPIEIIKNLRPYMQEDPLSNEFDAEDMGTGTQSALAVAIARAYAEIVKRPLVMAIEEPELYLHPHGCRHFYRLLRELSENRIQVIYTTHERSFVDISNFQSIHFVRKESGETKVYSGIGKTVSPLDAIKMASKFDERVNEVFFANHVIVSEGAPDKIACQLALEKLGLKIDKEGISIIECEGNQNIKPICEVLRHFKIPVYVLTDEDPDNPNTKEIISSLKSFLGEDYLFLQKPNLEGMFRFEGKLSKIDALEFFPDYFSKHPVPEVYKQLANKIRGKNETY